MSFGKLLAFAAKLAAELVDEDVQRRAAEGQALCICGHLRRDHCGCGCSCMHPDDAREVERWRTEGQCRPCQLCTGFVDVERATPDQVAKMRAASRRPS
jgi:hypothetical protein